MYCIVTMVRFVIILIKFYVCMYVCLDVDAAQRFSNDAWYHIYVSRKLVYLIVDPFFAIYPYRCAPHCQRKGKVHYRAVLRNLSVCLSVRFGPISPVRKLITNFHPNLWKYPAGASRQSNITRSGNWTVIKGGPHFDQISVRSWL